MKTIPLLFTLGLTVLSLRADPTPAESSAAPVASVPATVPKTLPAAAGPGANPRAMPYMGPQSVLTPEENKILAQARIELQKDPELVELSNEIKALMDKRMKLTEEKLQKLNPEAAAVLQKLKSSQEKMMAERKAQMEAMQAKYKAQQEATQAAAAKPVAVPVATPSPVTATPSP